MGSVIACKQSDKVPIKFKLSIVRDRVMKTYDFEGTNERETGFVYNNIQPR